MEMSPTPPRSGVHTSRRSFPNLQQLSLAPLSSRFPLDEDNIDAGYDQSAPSRSSSYIQSTTAPTTPSILSRSSSQQRRENKTKKNTTYYSHESYFPTDHDPNAPLTKAKSSSALLSRKAAGLPTLSPIVSREHSHVKAPSSPTQAQQANDEWLYRAGAAIAEESRLAKGQSWLVTRDSSTSLVTQIPLDDDRDREAYTSPTSKSRLRLSIDGEESAILDDGTPATPRWPASISRGASRPGSRHGAGSRVASRAQSRRGSRTGRLDAFAMTSASGAPGQPHEGGDGYFDSALGEGPDFVDPNDVDGAVAGRHPESRVEEEEVRKLASQKGFGLGGVLDRLVGWTLFNVDDDREESEREEARGRVESADEAKRRRELESQRRKAQLESAASSSALATQSQAADMQAAAEEGQGGWKDAAWLLSVASKVIL